jgi:hypothetical protein
VDKDRQQALMRTIFGDRYDAASASALAVIKYEGDDNYFLMTLTGAAELPDGRTVVAVNGAPSDENRADQSAHASPGMLNVYALRRTGTTWTVVERHENVESGGSSGDFGSVEWVMLGAGKPGFLVFSGGSWQGYMLTVVGVFELGKEVRPLGGFAKASGNDGACAPGMQDCWGVDGSIRFADNPQGGAYRDIVVDFTGRHFTLTEGKDGNDVEHLKSRVRQSVRYRFDGKEYVPVSGTNPVPGV